MICRHRVYAYITGPQGLLILAHPDHPEAGLQVPGGTVEAGETPGQAVLREVEEETTLTEVRIVSLLGQEEFDMRKWGMQEIQKAYFYHLTCREQTPRSWLHHEIHGPPEPIAFRLYWAELPYVGTELIAHHGDFLAELDPSACQSASCDERDG